MIDQILHVGSRCGGGKSRETIKELIDHLLSNSSIDDTYIFASKTNDLTTQNYEFVDHLIQNHVTGKPLPIRRVDSIRNKGTVVRDFGELLTTGFKGVIFISHSTLALTSADRLKGCRIVVDEVPQELAGCLMVKHDAIDHGYPWDKYLINVASPHSSYMRVRIDPNADEDDIRRYIDGIRQNKDNTTTRNVADLLEFLLVDYEAAYTTTTNSDGSLTRLYQAVRYHRLKDLANQIDFLAILSVQVKDSLFGYIADHHLGLPIVERDINDRVTLVQKHKNRVRIIPFLKEGRWSTTLRMRTANTALIRNKQPVDSKLPVRLFAQEFASELLGTQSFMITLNQDDKLIEALDRPGIVQTSTAVHGMNHLAYLDHAVYLASTNPTPFDNKSLRMFAKDNSLDAEDLLRAVMIERCYETAYQCVARTSIRDEQHDPNKEHIIVVPDLHYAEYLAEWFEDGCAVIDTQHSFLTEYAEEKRAQEEVRRNIVTHILVEQSLKKDKLKNLLVKAGISRSTFKRYKNEFFTELVQVGLLKPRTFVDAL